VQVPAADLTTWPVPTEGSAAQNHPAPGANWNCRFSQ